MAFFQQENYEIPKIPSNYMKFEDGLNRFRVLGQAITGYEYFNRDNKPVRQREPFDEIPTDIKEKGQVKHFWAFPVYNYQAFKNEKGEWQGKVQVLELIQKTIMKPFKAIMDNPKWGDPLQYDIAITKTGEGIETEYNVQAEPPIGEPIQEIKDAYAEVNITLSNLYDGTDLFGK